MDIATLTFWYTFLLFLGTVLFYFGIISITIVLIADYINRKKFDKQKKKYYNKLVNEKLKRRF